MAYELEEILRSVGIPSPSQKIYKELLERGETTARVLSERLMITRPSTYDHLALLKKKGLIIEKEIDNKSYYAVDDVRRVGTMLQDSIETLSEKQKLFADILPTLGKGARTGTPTVKFFEGKVGLTHLLNEILWHGEKEIFTMWPYDEMLAVLGKETLVRFNERRLQEKIRIHTLWPYGKKLGNEYIWTGKDALTERRIARKGVRWSMGYTIYGNKVSFISSTKEVFGFIVSSQEFATLMKIQFDALWREGKSSR